MAKKAATSSRGSKPRKGSRLLKPLNASPQSQASPVGPAMEISIENLILTVRETAQRLRETASELNEALAHVKKLSARGIMWTPMDVFSTRPSASSGAIRTIPGSSKRAASPKSRFVRDDGRLA